MRALMKIVILSLRLNGRKNQEVFQEKNVNAYEDACIVSREIEHPKIIPPRCDMVARHIPRYDPHFIHTPQRPLSNQGYQFSFEFSRELSPKAVPRWIESSHYQQSIIVN